MTITDTSQWFHWDPSPDVFIIPYFGRAIAWYGVFFAISFALAYYVMRLIMEKHLHSKEKSLDLCDRLLLFVIIGTVVGARLGHILFYENLEEFLIEPLRFFKTWEGGLASHGGGLGILLTVALFVLKNKAPYPKLTLLTLIDALVIPTSLVAACIRIGNFFNQELVGRVTTVPWAVVFGHPFSGVPPLPRHPTQLYESFAYFATFLLLHQIWEKNTYPLGQGRLLGIFLTLVFTFRFFVEFLKLPQSTLLSPNSYLLMGQYLSIPFILAGVYLWRRKV